MKILIITTGGTIGSTYDGDTINVRQNRSLPVVDLYRKNNGSNIVFEIQSPVNILSENITWNDLLAIYDVLSKTDCEKYDGVILTCGSDTIAYISAFTGLLFENRNIAVVATNRMLELEGSNGYDNFSKAVEVLSEGTDRVIVPWRNSDGCMHVFDATAILPCNVNGDIYQGGSAQMLKGDISDIHDHKNILMISPYPFMDYERFDLDYTDAVLHLTYHSGTSDDARIVRFADACKIKGIKIYFTGISQKQRIYNSTKKLMDLGMIPLYDTAYPCAYIKLMLGDLL